MILKHLKCIKCLRHLSNLKHLELAGPAVVQICYRFRLQKNKLTNPTYVEYVLYFLYGKDVKNEWYFKHVRYSKDLNQSKDTKGLNVVEDSSGVENPKTLQTKKYIYNMLS